MSSSATSIPQLIHYQTKTITVAMTRTFYIFILLSILININISAQSSHLQLPSISDHTDLLIPYENRIQTAIDAFFDETQIEVNVISAYRFAQDEPFKIKDIWKESANFSLLITVNLHEDLQPLDWEWGANIALTNSVDAEEELPFSLLEYAKTEVMLPILQGLPDAEGRIFRSPEKYAEAIIQALEFIKEKKKTNYFLINGNKYYDGVVAHLAQKDEETLVIQAFKHNGQSFPEDAVWEGVPNQVTGGEASFSINEPSSSAQGQLVKVSFLQGSKLINLAIRVVIIKVTFAAFPDQVFGFDENPKFPVEGDFTCYPSYATTPPEDGLPWKALGIDEKDKVTVNIEPIGIRELIFIMPSNNNAFSVTYGQENEMTITGNIENATTLVSAVIGGQGGTILSSFKAKVYAPKEQKILLVKVGSKEDYEFEGALYNFGQIQETLTRIYGEANVNLTEIAEYDLADIGDLLNNEGKLPVPETSIYSGEMKNIFDNCAFCQDAINMEYKIVFIVNYEPTFATAGRWWQEEDYGFVFPMIFTDERLPEIVAHEMGHGLFNLDHPWLEFNSLFGPLNIPCNKSYPALIDQHNIMDYGQNTPKLFRKYQWDQIHQ